MPTFDFGSLASSLMGTGTTVDQDQLQQLIQKLKNKELTTATRTGKPTEAPGTDSSADSKPTVAPVQPHKESWLKGALAGFLNPDAAASTYFDRGTTRRNLAAQREHAGLTEADKDARDLKAMSTALSSGGKATPEALLAAAKSAAALQSANEFNERLGARPFMSDLGSTTAQEGIAGNKAGILKHRVAGKTDVARLQQGTPGTTALTERLTTEEKGQIADANMKAELPYFDAAAAREGARAGGEESGLRADTIRNFRDKNGAQALSQLKGMEFERDYTTAKRSKEEAIEDVVSGVPQAQAKAEKALADLKTLNARQDGIVGERTPEQLKTMQKLSAEIEMKIGEGKLAATEAAFIKDKTTISVLSKIYDSNTGTIDFKALNALEGKEKLVALRALDVLGWVRSSDLDELDEELFKKNPQQQQKLLEGIRKLIREKDSSGTAPTNTTSIPLISPNKV